MPTMVADQIDTNTEVILHSENGILGVGPRPAPGLEDPDLIDAGKDFVTLRTGAAIFHHTDSFVMMRGGHLDVAVLGGFQVSQEGDLANWATNDETYPPAVGGAMDLASGAKAIYVMMMHNSREGKSKILCKCTYPLTASKVVHTVYTDLAILDFRGGEIYVREMTPGLTEAELIARTEARLTF
jgi:3-oxoacid CoA-transferase B subunit